MTLEKNSLYSSLETQFRNRVGLDETMSRGSLESFLEERSLPMLVGLWVMPEGRTAGLSKN